MAGLRQTTLPIISLTNSLFLSVCGFFLPLAVGGTLPAALGTVNRRRWRAFFDEWTRGETARVAFWSKPQVGQGVLQHGQ